MAARQRLLAAREQLLAAREQTWEGRESLFAAQTLSRFPSEKPLCPRNPPPRVSGPYLVTTLTLQHQSFVVRAPLSMIDGAFESPKPVLFNGIFRFTNIFLSTKWQLCFWPRSQKSELRRGGFSLSNFAAIQSTSHPNSI